MHTQNLRNLNLRDALEWEVSLLALTDLTDLTELEISQVTTGGSKPGPAVGAAGVESAAAKRGVQG
jgi:hypothetical protein